MSPRRWFYAGVVVVFGAAVALVLAQRAQVPTTGAVFAGLVAALGLVCVFILVAVLSGRD